jgi:exopolysaccharide biosynthesis polyprenyl glycosylphosphotransferase
MNSYIYKRSLSIPALKLIFDAISIELAIAFSYWLRFYSPLTKMIPVTKGIPGFSLYVGFSIFLIAGYLALFIAFSSYRTRIFTTFSQDIPVILKVSILGILLAMSGAFLYRDFSFSRLVFALFFINTLIFLLIFRLLFHKLKSLLIKKDYNVFRVYIVGSIDRIGNALEQLSSSKNYAFNILGYFAEKELERSSHQYMGSPNQLNEILQTTNFDGLVITYNQYDYHKTLDIIRAAEGKNIELFYMPEILDLLTANFDVIETSGFLLLQIKKISLSGWQGFIKSIFDLIVSVLTMIIFSPLFLVLALLIRITSKGPVFYRQRRIGLDGHEFEIIKFRSMVNNAEQKSGPVWAEKNDTRVTAIGRFLRRTSLDELPQIINVIKGDMSIVGPRPERPHFVQKFKSYIPKYSERHRVRSGITGWAQVNGLRGQSPIEERTRYDVYYIENWTLWFDIKILIMTFLAIVRGENAY